MSTTSKVSQDVPLPGMTLPKNIPSVLLFSSTHRIYPARYVVLSRSVPSSTCKVNFVVHI